MRLHSTLRTAVAVACAAALGAAPLLVHTTATAKTAEAAEAAIQSITIKVAKRAIIVRGARGLDAGRVKVAVKGRGTAEIIMFDRGYDYRDFKRDVAAVEKGNIKALKRALAHTEFFGGFEAGGSGTVVLPKAGEYTVFSFASRGHADFRAGAFRKAPTPDVDGRIIGRTGPKWGGSSHLPAKGTFKFKNADRTVPHFVILQQVAEGTTTDQVLEVLQSEEQGPPPAFFLPAGLETASISSGRSMTVNYNLPPGQYVVMCFFPDPHMGGMPHALMGMLKMIHLN
jgi:CO dehydrogenase/acetyl-CoA synthase epsilon subunit